MQYSVGLYNIPATDRLVFKLIFSLSEKVRGRLCSYVIDENTSAERVDIVIQGEGENGTVPAPGSHCRVWFGRAETNAGDTRYVIGKPLLATRVLNVLDQFVEQECDSAVAALSDPDQTALSIPSQLADEDAPEVEFCITEEEASELAIVDDESLANPSNTRDVSEDQPAQLPIMHSVASPEKEKTSLVMLRASEDPSSPGVQKHSGFHQADRRPRALVLDDSPSVRKQLELELDLFSVDVDFAETMTAAMNLIKESQYDVAFLDVVLPDGDGFQVCKSIKHDIKDIKVIMLTGRATPADKIKGTMVGCDSYLVKPVGRMTFQNTVCKYLQLREQLEAVHA